MDGSRIWTECICACSWTGQSRVAKALHTNERERETMVTNELKEYSDKLGEVATSDKLGSLTKSKEGRWFHYES